ncbi:MAG TPA: hypothetical protein VFW22_04315 [Pseudolabrys sp.]|nr:hypothetical protein [Pseudolabrys sp.]
MRKLPAFLVLALTLTHLSPAAAAGLEPVWTVVLHPKDYVLGNALKRLQTRRAWVAAFDERSGGFEIAVRKTAVVIPAPQCRMDYLILKIPFYYPETPKQASAAERRKIYDAFASLQTSGKGSITTRVEAPLNVSLARMANGRFELTACSLFFAFPLSVQRSTP